MPNFNRIAPIYDSLSKLVFGNAVIRASNYFIGELPNQGRALFIGGGSGIVLNEILKLKANLQIDFIEQSEKFISIAKKKLHPEFSNRVHFIHGDQNFISTQKKYSSVITFCIVDVFQQKEAEGFCSKIISHLESNGIWLFVDFIPPKKMVQKLLLKFMYFFFRIVTSIPAKKLPDYDFIFEQLKMKVEKQQFFYSEMICSKVLKRG